MFSADDSNEAFDLAVALVQDTSQHLFLTGKAGTGKTTFLRFIREKTKKASVVVAPTGVAAINAGGVTMHSFFQLPRGMFVPGTAQREGFIGYADITDRHSLFKNIHFNSNKRDLLQELELLIIDEVSMVRCDMLDAIDTVLRHFRKAPDQPFGGVQVVFIGDLYQLPPVVSAEEWDILKGYYETPFFFSAHAVRDNPPLYIELKKIYRQSDAAFIEVLNRVRNNRLRTEDLLFLNARYQPSFHPPEGQHYITLTTHNKRADAINTTELQRLPGTLHSFQAEVKDDFSEKAAPTEHQLQLKEGAQIMFIKNDSGAERRYFNGRLAVVRKIRGEEITISFEDGSEDLKLEKETWKNIRYIYNKENDEIDEEELGSFTQYPIRLAWAITVHKSQGLTFDQAVIDAGSSFAPGQVYVALSRCTNIEGMVLRSPIHASVVKTDERIIRFAQQEADIPRLKQVIETEKYRHWGINLVRLFDWSKLTSALYEWMMALPEAKIPKPENALVLARSLTTTARAQSEVARKFQQQLRAVLQPCNTGGDTTQLQARMEKALAYFSKAVADDILRPLQQHVADMEHVSRIKKYKDRLHELEGLVWQYLERMAEASYGPLQFRFDRDYFAGMEPALREQRPKGKKKGAAASVAEEPGGKLLKRSSMEETLGLWRSGKTIEDIAAMRGLAHSTVGSHLATLIHTGAVKVEELVAEEKIPAIMTAIDTVGVQSIGNIKNRLGDEYDFSEIRAVMNHWRWVNSGVEKRETTDEKS